MVFQVSAKVSLPSVSQQGGPDSRSPVLLKKNQNETTKDNVKSRENQEKSDSKSPNDAVIIWKLPIGKQALFSGSRAEENLRKTGGFL